MSTIREAEFARKIVKGDNPSAERTFFVFDAANETAAYTDVAATLGVFEGLYPRSLNLEPFGLRAGTYVYRAVVQYGPVPSALGSDSDEPSFAFEFGGTTAKMTHFLEAPTSYAPSGGTAPNNNWAINVKDGVPEGVEVDVPTFGFSLTKWFDQADLTIAYQLAVASCVKKVNATEFRGFGAGTVKFASASGSASGQNRVPIQFRFEVSPNATGLSVGDITGIDKPGWHYLSVTYKDDVDATGKALVPKPVGVEVGPVLFTADFSVLGLD